MRGPQPPSGLAYACSLCSELQASADGRKQFQEWPRGANGMYVTLLVAYHSLSTVAFLQLFIGASSSHGIALLEAMRTDVPAQFISPSNCSPEIIVVKTFLLSQRRSTTKQSLHSCDCFGFRFSRGPRWTSCSRLSSRESTSPA